MNAKLNKRERRAQQLLAHYATCERLAKHLGVSDPDGKKISVALWKIEREANAAATAQCNGEAYMGQPYRESCDENGEESDSSPWEQFADSIRERVAAVFGGVLPAGFSYNGDPRGYALKIDPDRAGGRELIKAVGLPTDWGSNGLLSPEITGD